MMTGQQAVAWIHDALGTPRVEASRQMGVTVQRFASLLHEARAVATRRGLSLHVVQQAATPERGFDQALSLAREAGLLK